MLLLLSIGVWTMFPYVASRTLDDKTVLFYSRLVYIAAIFTPANFYRAMSILLENEKLKINKVIIKISYFTSSVLCLFSFSRFFIKGINKYQPNFFVEPGILYPFFIAFFGLICGMTFYNLYVNHKKAIGARKNQVKYVFVAFTVAFIGGVLHVFAPYVNMELIPHDAFIISFAAIITYVVIRYRLLDMTIAIRNTIVYAGEVCVLSVFLFFLFGFFGFKELLPLVLSSLGIAIGILPLRILIKNFVDNVIFKGKYNYQKALIDITNVVPTIIDQQKLLAYIADSVTKCMHIEKAVVFVKEERRDAYEASYAIGLNGQSRGKVIESKNNLIVFLRNYEDILMKYELSQSLSYEEVCELWEPLKTFEVELVVPFHKGESLIGFMCLSNKGGGDVFNKNDFQILQTISNQAAVVVENIRLYNKLIHSDRQTFLETLASGVSHEMRNRLVAIRTFIDLFPERVKTENVDKDYVEFRNLAEREMGRLTKIIDGLLSYSRAVVTGGEPLNINGVLEEALLIIQPKFREKEIVVKTGFSPDVGFITGDKGRLLQVFINIIQNGVDAMNKGGTIEIATVSKEDAVEIKISDNGKGIPKEHLDAIFEPFFTTKHNGTGLGLSIVQRIIKDHGGVINVTSIPNEGTTFIISIPKQCAYSPVEVGAKEDLKYWNVKRE